MTGASQEARLAAAIDATGTITAADQLAGIQRMLRAGRALQQRRRTQERSLVADLTERVRARA